MYSIVGIKGHQYEVRPGTLIDVEKMNDAEEGTFVDLNEVLFIGGEKPQVGMPTVPGAKVLAKVVRHRKDRKLIVFRRSPGKYQRRRGHRQEHTCLLITEIHNGLGDKMTLDKESALAKKFLN
jgi:large subunit ribosomal protein L21